MKNEYLITMIRKPREALGESEKRALLEKLIPVTRDGFGTPVTAGDIENHVLNVDTIYVVELQEGYVGFASFDELLFGEVRVLYLSGTVFASQHQRKGLLGKILDQAIAELRGDYIAARTQNPNLYVSLARKCAAIYPNGNTPPPEDVKSVVASLAEARGMRGLDPETFVEIGTYGGCMTGTVPIYTGKDQDLACAFEGIGLEPERGDSVLLVGLLVKPSEGKPLGTLSRGFPPNFTMADTKRLTETFINLAEIESPSGKEEEARLFVEKELNRLGLKFRQDKKGNLIVKKQGEGMPLLIGCHLDTVEPCAGVRVFFRNGLFRSDGVKILGADNKASVAAILEFLKILAEQNLKTCPLEIVFTVQEELGSKGASALDFSKIKSKRGIVFDLDGPFGTITSAAPFYYIIDIEIKGKSAHAGLEPEKGVSAIAIAAAAVNSIRQGRIDDETTVNVGEIAGGESRNTIPEAVLVKVETRSLNNKKAQDEAKKVVKAFQRAANNYGGSISAKIINAACGFKIEENDDFVREVKDIIREIGFRPKLLPTCGGSDANIFNARGIKTLNLTYGARSTHTTKENIKLKDLENMVKLLLKISTKK